MKRLPKNLVVILFAVFGMGVLLLFITGILKFYRIPTRGMSPTLIPGDLVFSTRSYRSPHEFRRGDLVIFMPPTDPKSRFIQRITALPGDRIEVIDGHLAVNGTLLKSPTGLISTPATLPPVMPSGCRRMFYPLMVPENQVFLMGDNYENSLDSRYFGFVPMKSITHAPKFIAFPPDRVSRLK